MYVYFESKLHLLRAIYRAMMAENYDNQICVIEHLNGSEKIERRTERFCTEPYFISKLLDPNVMSVSFECDATDDSGNKERIYAHFEAGSSDLSIDLKQKGIQTPCEEDFEIFMETFSFLLSRPH